jgi:hypothetical protein
MLPKKSKMKKVLYVVLTAISPFLSPPHSAAQIKLAYSGALLLNDPEKPASTLIASKVYNNKFFQLSYDNPILSSDLTLTILDFITQQKRSITINLNNDLNYSNSVHKEPIVDFELQGKLICFLTSKRILLFEITDSLPKYYKKIEWEIEAILKNKKVPVEYQGFRRLNLSEHGNIISLSKDFVTLNQNPKICIVKFYLSNYELTDVKYYSAGDNIIYKDPFSLYSSNINHLAGNIEGNTYFVKTGFQPMFTQLSQDLKETDSFYLNLYDTSQNTPLRSSAENNARKYFIKNSIANLDNLLNTMDSVSYITKIGHSNGRLFVQIQDPKYRLMFKSYLVSLTTSNKLTDSNNEIYEDALPDLKAKDTLTTENFPIIISNLPCFISGNHLYVIIHLYSYLRLNKCTVGDVFFKKQNKVNTAYTYVIRYNIVPK